MDQRTTEERRPLPAGAPALLPSGANFWRVFAQAATIGIFLLLFVAALSLGRGLLLPVVAGIVIGTMFGPLTERAARYGVPSWLSAILSLILLVALFNLVIVILSAPVAEWIGKGPEIAQSVKEKLHVLDRPLAALSELRRAFAPQDQSSVAVAVSNAALVEPVLSVLTPAIGQLVIFFGTLYFFLVARTRLYRHLVIFFEEREARLRTLRIINEAEQNLASYLGLVALINLGVGTATAAFLFAIGFPNPLTWGALAFVLNFIPFVGPAVMTVVLFAVGIVTFPSLGQALLAPAIFVGMTAMEGNFITPSIIGRRLTLHPLAVFLGLAFWTWLWGPIGAFLAAPLLIVAHVAIDHIYPKDEVNLPE